MTKQW